jgi:hypothetical protein
MMDCMTPIFYKVLSPSLPSVFSTLPLIYPKVRHFLFYANHCVVYDTHSSKGVRNTTTVFDRPARERVRLVSDWGRSDDVSYES